MKNPDRLYELLPAVYRQRDADQGCVLQALLRVVTEQVEAVEGNISQLYENWFIETCEDWVVPYIGDLIGYELISGVAHANGATSSRAQQRQQILIPRPDVANTLRARRRKGTLALLEELSANAAGWPARAVEYFRLLGWTQNLHTPLLAQPQYHFARADETLQTIAQKYQIHADELGWLNPSLEPAALLPGTRVLIGHRSARGKTVDLRRTEDLDLIDSAFDRTAHTVSVRRVDSHRTPGRYNIPAVSLIVWRLRSYSVGWQNRSAANFPSRTPAYCLENEGPHCYTFSILGNDTPLFNRPQPEATPTSIASELNLPVPIRRRRFDARLTDYYGSNGSLNLWVPDWPTRGAGMPVPASAIKVADLAKWHYRARNGTVLIDPERGRIVFPVRQRPTKGVTVQYHYGFSADLGGGEYERQLSQPADARLYFVGEDAEFTTIGAALAQWNADKKIAAPAIAANVAVDANASGTARPSNSAVIEITDSGAYTEKIVLKLDPFESLQIRAANRRRPVLRLLDYVASQGDALVVSGGKSSRFTLDGLLITGRGLQIRGPDDHRESPDAPGGNQDDGGDMCDVTIRHCTLVPGWGLDSHCKPVRPAEPSIAMFNSTAKVRIEHSIVGAIHVLGNEAQSDPVSLSVSDSFLDATDNERFALSGPDESVAFAQLTIARSTVFGKILTHEIALAENSLFSAMVCVARRQRGCVRFCYVPPDSRTPRRYECQPDEVLKAVNERFADGEITAVERDTALASEASRVVPVFNSIRYGTPTYGQLAAGCAEEITSGADDESEMGAFHDLYQPQRAANLRTRLADYTPAGMDAGIINAT